MKALAIIALLLGGVISLSACADTECSPGGCGHADGSWHPVMGSQALGNAITRAEWTVSRGALWVARQVDDTPQPISYGGRP